MSHRLEQKKAAREARLRAKADARRAEKRQRLMRRVGYAAVAAVAATLITLAAVLGGGSKPPANHEMGGTDGNGPAIGAKAPAFELTDAVSGKRVSLRSLRGRKTMLFFSEGVSCQACLAQAADLEKAGTLKKAGIELVSVSTDEPGDLSQAAGQYGITTPMLADPSIHMSHAYGMLGHGGMGHPTLDGHAFMLLSADGTVLWHRAYQEMYVKPGQLMADMKAEAKA